jgi:hypothetical protein
MCTCGIASRPPRGAALVVAMLVMAVLLMAGMTFLTIASTERMIALNERTSVQATLLAEAAVHRAIARLNASASYAGESDVLLGPGRFSVSVSSAAAQSCPGNPGRDLVATASVPVAGGQAQADIRATVDQVSYPFRWALYSTLRNNVLHWDNLLSQDRAESELWLASGVVTESFDSAGGVFDSTRNRGDRGDIGAKGDITIDGITQIKGNVTAGHQIHLTSTSVTVTGWQTSSAPTVSFPAVTPPASTTTDLIVGTGATRTLPAGTYNYRNVLLGYGASLLTSGGPVTLFVGGTMSIEANVTVGADPSTNLQIIMKSEGDDWTSALWWSMDNLRLYASVYGRNTDIYLGVNSQVYGAIVGRTIYVESGSQIRFDRALMDQSVCRSGRYTIRRGSWREYRPTS